MALYKTPDNYYINPEYIIIVGKVVYNNTSEKYYFSIALHGYTNNIILDFNTEEEAAYERNQLIGHMRT
jgi:hypothetical protein